MKRKIGALLFGALAVLGCDILVKTYIVQNLPIASSSVFAFPFGGISVFHGWHGIDCALVHVANRGAAWGLFSSWQEILLYLRIAILGGLFFYVTFFSMTLYRRASFLLIGIGALGNVLDYFVHGHVIDMFYFSFWGYSYPVFNVADSAIFCGIVLLLGQKVYERFSSKKSVESK